MLINCSFTEAFAHHTLHRQYELLEKCWRSDRYEVMQCDVCIAPFDRARSLINYELRNWLAWVNKNICIPIASEKNGNSTAVKLRIATGMLNKIESLTDLEKIQIHSNLTNNVHKEIYLLRLDGLPF